MENKQAPWVAKHGLVAPYGKCQCGCGQDAPISKATYPKQDRIKGQPARFITGHSMHTRSKSVPEELFWQNVEEDAPDCCWEWKGKTGHRGYGYFYAQSKLFVAHRFSYELHIGPIPHELLVCHKCDNPACQNPNHFFMGTHADNNRDRVTKGRFIRTLCFKGKTMAVSQWAKEFQMSETTLRSRINRGWDAERALTTPLGKPK